MGVGEASLTGGFTVFAFWPLWPLWAASFWEEWHPANNKTPTKRHPETRILDSFISKTPAYLKDEKT